MRFLLIASFPTSLVKFRGDLIDALLAQGITVHVAVPDLDSGSEIFKTLHVKGVVIHNMPLCRTGMNPFKDFFLLFNPQKNYSPQYVLSSIQNIIY